MNKIIISLLAILCLVGCNTKDKITTGNVYNNYDREVAINDVPEKVLTLGPNCSEIFCELGLEDYIIGNSLDNHSRGPLLQYKEAYAKIPELTYSSATREAVLTSGADFIYGIDWEFGKQALDVDELTNYGINVYMNKATNFDEVFKEIRDIAKIFKVESKAEKFINDQEKRINKVKEAVKNRDKVKVLVYDSGSNGIFTCSGSNYESLLIEQAGGKNIFSDLNEASWITVSNETVLQRQPDVIIVHDYDNVTVEDKIREIKADPALSKLECVKNNCFITITLESVLPGVRMAYSIERLAKGFYPDAFE